MTNLVGILCGDKIWKRVFSSALLLIVFSTFFLSSAGQVLAQPGPAGGPIPPPPLPVGGPGTFQGGGTGNLGGGGTGTPVPGTVPGSDPTVFGPGPTTDPSVAAAQAEAQAAALAASEGLGSTPDGVLGLIYGYVLTGVGWVVGIAGSAFDYSIENFIIGFGQLYRTGTGETIDLLWGTVRDIFNLTFIFGLVYIGFKMILDSSDSSARKMLVSLIGAALLVNFSLFITKFVIDFSNIAATQVYNALQSSDPDGQLSITNGFMTIMGINSILDYEYTAGGSFAFVLGVLIIFCILAYVFLAGAVLIIIRFVVLNIYMVFSPFMFLGWVFPALASYSRDYWSGFMRQAFFAPAFIFMLYLSYVVASTFPTQRNLGLMFNPNATTVTDIASMIPYFAMVMVFLCASMIVAKKMGAHGSTMAINVGNKLRGNAQSFIGRNTVGRGASWMAKNQDTTGGRVASAILTTASLGTFNNRTQRELYEKGKKAKFGGSYSRSDDKEYRETVSSNISTENKKAASAAIIKAGLADGATPEQVMAMQSVVAGMSTSQLESMKDSTRNAIASSMTASQVEALMKSDKIGSDDKTAIGKARKQAIVNIVEKNNEVISTELTKLTVEQIEDAGADFITKHAGLFTSAQIDDIKKSKKYNPAQKAAFSSARSTYHKSNAGAFNTTSTLFNTYSGKDTNGNSQYKRRKSADIAAMGTDVLLSQNSVSFLQIGDLEAIGDKKTLERSDRDKLKANIENEAQGGSRHAKDLLSWLNSPQAQRLNW